MRIKKVIENLSDIENEINDYNDIVNMFGYDNSVIQYYIYACEIFEKISLINMKDFMEEEIVKLSAFSKPSMSRDWEAKEVQVFDTLIENIAIKTAALKNSLEKTLHNSNIDNVYAIKLPEFENFSDVVDFGKDLNLVFKKVIGNEKKARLVGFDVGSEWYLIGFELFEDFKLFAEFMGCVYVLLRKTVEDENTLKQIPEDEQDAVKEYMDSIKNVLVKNNVKKLESLKDKELTPEEVAELEKSLFIMEKLVQRGAEVHIDKQSPPKNEDDEFEEELVKLPNPEKIQESIATTNTLLIEGNNKEDSK